MAHTYIPTTEPSESIGCHPRLTHDAVRRGHEHVAICSGLTEDQRADLIKCFAEGGDRQ